ncbi:MAG: hydroxymethylbilane synthase [Candidatus Omnitrophica bacterium]|nr:hydroxymethylbilane synthase [Candidatus Omnitrophota bacterium]
MKRSIIIGARGSLLSLSQANQLIEKLKKLHPDFVFQLQPINTLGDKITSWQRNYTGIFVKELEDALLSEKIDIAIHSLKDMPTQLNKHFEIAAITKREDPRDVIISYPNKKHKINELSIGAVVGTTSLRRKAQLLSMRPDLNIKQLRGNLDTRIKKLKQGLYEAIVVAYAGIKRLKLTDLPITVLDLEHFLPACGQGALAVEVRLADRQIKGIVKPLDDFSSRICVTAERAFLHYSQAGCRMPVAAYAFLKDGKITLKGMIISLDGSRKVYGEISGSFSNPQKIGYMLAKKLLATGGKQILKEIKDAQE